MVFKTHTAGILNLTAGALNASGIYFSVKGNSINLPFYTNANFTNYTLDYWNTIAAGTWAPVGNTTQTLMPMGIHNIALQYQNYVCWESYISVTCVPSNDADSIILIITQQMPSEPQISAAAVPVQQIMEMPYSKYKICQPNTPMRDRTVTSRMNVLKLLGQSRTEYDGSTSGHGQLSNKAAGIGGVAYSDPGNCPAFVLGIQTLTSAAPNNNFYLDVQVFHKVTLFNPVHVQSYLA